MARRLVPLLGASLLIALLAAPLAPAWTPSAAPPATEAAPLDALPSAEATRQSPMRALAEQYAASFPLDPLPEGLDAQGRADHLLNERLAQGRTPAAWIELAQGYALDGQAAESTKAGLTLDEAVAALYAAVGAPASASDLEAARAAAGQVPESLRGPLADLVAATAAATVAQAPVAAGLASRWSEYTPAEPFLPSQERDAMAARAAALVDGIDAMAASVGPLPDVAVPVAAAVCLAPVAPDCLAWLGSCGNDLYAPTPGPFPDPALVVEPCGDDTYTNSAGGANPTGLIIPGPNPAGGNGLAVAVVADLGGNDDYTYTGEVSVLQGSGSVGGLGLLVDTDGDDLYFADFVRTNVGPPLVGGAVGMYYIDGGAQGTGFAGLGLLLDAWGDDVYDLHIASTQGRCIWGFAQGFGSAGGLGISSDLWGDDDWLSSGNGLTGGNDCWGIGGSNDAFQGLYPQGVGIQGGVGIMTDHGFGADDYLNYNNATVVDYYAQGFGALGGLGILVEDGGNDVYVAYEKATATWIVPVLNCAYGTGSLGGAGIMVELGGDDRYLVETVSDKSAESMMEGDGEPIPGYGLFIDADGTDRHEGIATAGPGWTARVYGRGSFDAAHNLAGTYLDLGSDADTYIPVIGVFPFGPATNNNAWLFGADL